MITLGNIEPVPEKQPPAFPIEDKDHWWEHVDWTGAVAFVLALGVSGSMGAAMFIGMFAAFMHNRPISEQGAAMLSTIFGALIGALATFLGQNRPTQKQSEKNLK